MAGDRLDPDVSQAVAAARRGDRDAVGYLYCRYADALYAEVLSIIPDPSEAQRLTQDVFAKLETMLPRYADRGVPFLAWLRLAARNMARAQIRARRGWPELDRGGGGSP